MEYALSELFTLQMGKTPSRDNSSYWKKIRKQLDFYCGSD